MSVSESNYPRKILNVDIAQNYFAPPQAKQNAQAPAPLNLNKGAFIQEAYRDLLVQVPLQKSFEKVGIAPTPEDQLSDKKLQLVMKMLYWKGSEVNNRANIEKAKHLAKIHPARKPLIDLLTKGLFKIKTYKNINGIICPITKNVTCLYPGVSLSDIENLISDYDEHLLLEAEINKLTSNPNLSKEESYKLNFEVLESQEQFNNRLAALTRQGVTGNHVFQRELKTALSTYKDDILDNLTALDQLKIATEDNKKAAMKSQMARVPEFANITPDSTEAQELKSFIREMETLSKSKLPKDKSSVEYQNIEFAKGVTKILNAKGDKTLESLTTRVNLLFPYLKKKEGIINQERLLKAVTGHERLPQELAEKPELHLVKNELNTMFQRTKMNETKKIEEFFVSTTLPQEIEENQFHTESLFNNEFETKGESANITKKTTSTKFSSEIQYKIYTRNFNRFLQLTETYRESLKNGKPDDATALQIKKKWDESYNDTLKKAEILRYDLLQIRSDLVKKGKNHLDLYTVELTKINRQLHELEEQILMLSEVPIKLHSLLKRFYYKITPENVDKSSQPPPSHPNHYANAFIHFIRNLNLYPPQTLRLPYFSPFNNTLCVNTTTGEYQVKESIEDLPGADWRTVSYKEALELARDAAYNCAQIIDPQLLSEFNQALKDISKKIHLFSDQALISQLKTKVEEARENFVSKADYRLTTAAQLLLAQDPSYRLYKCQTREGVVYKAFPINASPGNSKVWSPVHKWESIGKLLQYRHLATDEAIESQDPMALLINETLDKFYTFELKDTNFQAFIDEILGSIEEGREPLSYYEDIVEINKQIDITKNPDYQPTQQDIKYINTKIKEAAVLLIELDMMNKNDNNIRQTKEIAKKLIKLLINFGVNVEKKMASYSPEKDLENRYQMRLKELKGTLNNADKKKIFLENVKNLMIEDLNLSKSLNLDNRKDKNLVASKIEKYLSEGKIDIDFVLDYYLYAKHTTDDLEFLQKINKVILDQLSKTFKEHI